MKDVRIRDWVRFAISLLAVEGDGEAVDSAGCVIAYFL